MRVALLFILPLAGFALGWLIRWLYARFELSSSEQRATRIIQDALKEAEAGRRETLIETKDQLLRERQQLERETRDQRGEVLKIERRLIQKEESLERRLDAVERQEKSFVDRERSLVDTERELEGSREKLTAELEGISDLSVAEARRQLIESQENEARHDAQVLINQIEQTAVATAEKRARSVIVTSIQRLATDITSEVSVASVSLPNDEMKGRIIGREGRNIRTLETLTGVDIIIDDTPEAVVLSCFDPVRRETARMALERLISDGRIHPARIEEVVARVNRDMGQIIKEEGDRVLFELGIHNLHPDGIIGLGRLRFRTSYGQNVLAHSKEVAILAGFIADEIGADTTVAKRASLLHDIGKGIVTEGEIGHAESGMELAKRISESEVVANAIGAHHNDIEPTSPEAIIVQIADAISAARPGARRETLDNYLKRLEDLERIADEYPGVEKTFAIQAGRELRILVANDRVNDGEARNLGKAIARRIEAEVKYPGRIKVTVIRETRITEYAR